MTIKRILPLGEPELRVQCKSVDDPFAPEVKRIIQDLRDTVEETFRVTGYGRGLAAPQLGYLSRMVYLSPRVTGRELVLINPVITACSKETAKVWDSCLCFLSIFMLVERHTHITVDYLDEEGRGHTLHAGPENDLAELLQHEIDHLNGVLCIDRVQNIEEIVSRECFEEKYRQESPYAA